VLADAADADDEDVVALVADAEADVEGLEGALLPDGAAERLEVVGGLEVERQRGACGAQLLGGELSGVVHLFPSSAANRATLGDRDPASDRDVEVPQGVVEAGLLVGAGLALAD